VLFRSGSGLSVRGFCRKNKLPESAFYFWRRELQRRKAEQEQGGCADRPAGGAAKVVFLPVHVTEEVSPPQAGGRIEIELAGGWRVANPAATREAELVTELVSRHVVVG
jgi:transposase-like protein